MSHHEQFDDKSAPTSERRQTPKAIMAIINELVSMAAPVKWIEEPVHADDGQLAYVRHTLVFNVSVDDEFVKRMGEATKELAKECERPAPATSIINAAWATSPRNILEDLAAIKERYKDYVSRPNDPRATEPSMCPGCRRPYGHPHENTCMTADAVCQREQAEALASGNQARLPFAKLDENGLPVAYCPFCGQASMCQRNTPTDHGRGMYWCNNVACRSNQAVAVSYPVTNPTCTPEEARKIAKELAESYMCNTALAMPSHLEISHAKPINNQAICNHSDWNAANACCNSCGITDYEIQCGQTRAISHAKPTICSFCGEKAITEICTCESLLHGHDENCAFHGLESPNG